MPTTVSIEQYSSEQISIYPNPTQDKLRLKLDGLNDSFSYTITTVNRGAIKHQNVYTKTAMIDSSDQPLGLYILQIRIDGIVITKKSLKYRGNWKYVEI